jgi:choline dehydrogenase-like flavoprotein
MKSFRTLTALAFAGVVLSQATVTPQSFAASTFDVVIVGGGTAGLVLANRLSAQQLRVGVIDAGSYNESGDPLIDIPYGASIYLQNPNATVFGNPKYDWGFMSVPQPALGGRSILYPRGKVLGGSSAINDMAWQRGCRADYDAWSTVFGNQGWDFDSLLPYFERAENWTSPIDGVQLIPGTTPADFESLASVQGIGGPVQTRYDTFLLPLDTLMGETSAALGYPFIDNPDDGNTTYVPLAGIAHSVDISTGKRSYAAPAYYSSQVRARENLSVLMGALASRIIWDNSTLGSGNITATGVEYIVNGTTYVVKAKQEVILSAGSLKTPQVLELSGVGNATILQEAGVPVVLDFPQIGENLLDQPVTVMDYLANEGVTTLDWLTWNQTYFNQQKELYDTAQTGAFTWGLSVSGNWPLENITSLANYTTLRTNLINVLHNTTLTPLQAAQYNHTLKMMDSGVPLVAFSHSSRGGVVSTAQPNEGYATVAVWLSYELSRGSIHINSSNPQASPLINPRFMESEWDLAVLSAATQFYDTMVASQPFASQIQSRITPNSTIQSDNQWSQYVLESVQSIYHASGTTPMAAQELGGVVDCRLRVYGLANVRIVDDGVLPHTLNGPPQQTVYAVAEKASDLILEDLLGR